ncbi:MAG: TonB-dependent receptor [Cellvibrionaceae bacterium]|nr:TonB-dependent receptor [Cellvibrionaceae bacterium]
MKKKISHLLSFSICSLVGANASHAADTAPGLIEEQVLVTGGKQAIDTLPGSATFIDESRLNAFLNPDITAILQQVPGVYVRQEDGYGLRPNIGLRGTNPERSTKITLMEDEILIAPAPYAAPAAYYVPNVNRMSAVEVFKGPSAIKYGPHTVGGAINFVTRPVLEADDNEVEIAVGEFGFRQLRGFASHAGETLGFWLDGLHYGSDGFKNLDNGDNTGFDRNDLNAKFLWKSQAGSQRQQELQIKFGYADERSNETYLGLSEQDFTQDPLQRYAASQLDEFSSEHTQVHVHYAIDFNNGIQLFAKAYRNEFERDWNKFDGFIGGADIYTVLANPGLFDNQMALLRGEVDSNTSSSLRLDVTNNSRTYTSQGIDVALNFAFEWLGLSHQLESGLRLHEDEVNRDHSQFGYFMQAGAMVFDGIDNRDKKALNRGEASAMAVYIRDEIRFNRWLISLGLRQESIDSEHQDFLPAATGNIASTQNVTLPGLGIFYHLNDALGLLAGINKGFSAKSASAAEAVLPEESVNYELGFRYSQGKAKLEVIGFYSDYANLLGRCRIVDSSCDGDVSGGTVELSGLELSGNYTFSAGKFNFPIDLVYTLTDASFQTSFNSNFDQWGQVDAGDELPYLPKAQGRLQLGIQRERFNANFALNTVGEMREVAGSGQALPEESVPSLTTFDLSTSYQLTSQLHFKFVVNNLSDEVKVVSRRPYGARPNMPRTLKVSAKYLW